MGTEQYLYLMEAKRPTSFQPVSKKSTQDDISELLDKALKKTGKEVPHTVDGLPIVNGEGMKKFIRSLSNAPTSKGLGFSGIVYGEAGIGKSAIMGSLGKEFAATSGRTFITLEDFVDQFGSSQESIKKNIGKYYIFSTQMASNFDPTLMMGIPNVERMSELGYVKETPLTWVAIMTQYPDSSGFLFLDEINNARSDVQKNLYSLLHFDERTFGGNLTVKGDWRIHAAGNRANASDPTAGYPTTALGTALKDRLNPVFMQVTYDEWLENFAEKATFNYKGKTVPLFHPLLMDFIADNPDSNFYVTPTDPEQDASKRPNTRNFESLSKQLYTLLGYKDNYEVIDDDTWRQVILAVSSSCGKKFATDFDTYCRAVQNIKIEDIIGTGGQPIIDTKDKQHKEYTNYMAVFKKRWRDFVRNFEPNFDKADDKRKMEMAQYATNYLDAINEVFQVDQKSGAEMLGVTLMGAMRPYHSIFEDKVTEYLESQGQKELATYIHDVVEEVTRELGVAKQSVKTSSKGKTKFMTTDEEAEEEGATVDPKKEQEIVGILKKALPQLP